MRPSLTFVLDSGLWAQALLLAGSIRKFEAQRHKVNVCVPQDVVEDPKVSEALEQLAPLDVDVVVFENDFQDYRIGNKIYALKAVTDDMSLFVDTDTVFAREFALESVPARTVAVNVSDFRTWHNPSEVELIRSLFGLDSSRARTEFEYYNAGAILVHDPATFGGLWGDTAKAIDRDERITRKRPWLDQIALPFALARAKMSVVPLGPNYNYPAHLYSVTPERIHLHYHHWDVLEFDRIARSRLADLIETYDLGKHISTQRRYPRILSGFERLFPGSVRGLVRAKNRLKFGLRPA